MLPCSWQRRAAGTKRTGFFQKRVLPVLNVHISRSINWDEVKGKITVSLHGLAEVAGARLSNLATDVIRYYRKSVNGIHGD